jgi:two-component system cell cycle response regulator DivK
MRRKRVLLVEDDAVSLKLMRDALVANGYETEELTNGLDVLPRLAETGVDPTTGVDLIVIDIGLPGLDGTEVTRRLKSTPGTRVIPVVAVTAYAMPGDERRARGAGCDVYLTKPLSFVAFISVVRALLGGSADAE